MAHPKMSVGVYLPVTPPLSDIRAFLIFARLAGLDSAFVEDHFQEFYPSALWDAEFSWLARRCPSPHTLFDYQTLLGSLAAHAGHLRLGVGVTEPIRRHPVLIAQALLTLANLTKRPPILGLGSGERENTEPYGLDYTHPVDRLEEALQIIRQCFASHEPINFVGTRYRLQRAIVGLKAPQGQTPEIWIAAHGVRMLRLTGIYGDGWLPHMVASPEEYAAKLRIIRAAAQEAGRNPDAITPALGVYIAVAPNERAARAMLDTRLLRFLGLLVPAELWHAAGAEHPFGAHFRGYVDIIPEQYDRRMLDEALAAVPTEVIGKGVIWGTPEQVTCHLRAFGEAGLRHVVLMPISALISKRDLFYALRATRKIARSLHSEG